MRIYGKHRDTGQQHVYRRTGKREFPFNKRMARNNTRLETCDQLGMPATLLQMRNLYGSVSKNHRRKNSMDARTGIDTRFTEIFAYAAS